MARCFHDAKQSHELRALCASQDGSNGSCQALLILHVISNCVRVRSRVHADVGGAGLDVQGGINTCDCTLDVGSMGPWICKMFLCKGCLSDVGVDSGCAVDVNKRTKWSCNPISGQKFTQHEYYHKGHARCAYSSQDVRSDLGYCMEAQYIPTLAIKDTMP